MEFAIPAQLLEVGNIHMKPFQKKSNYPPLATLQYRANNYTLKHFTLLTPPLKIESWNPVRGHLQLNCDKHQFFKTKFITIQEYLISTLFIHQTLLLGRKDLSHDTIRACFKTLFDYNMLSCFISTHYLFPLYEKGERVKAEDFVAELQPGREIRLVLQLTGVSQLQGAPYSFRIQHQILGAYLVDTAAPAPVPMPPDN